MLEKFLKPENLKPEHIQSAYGYLEDYCKQKNVTVESVVCNKDNVVPAAEYIHSQLSFAIRLALSKKTIASLLTEHFDFIKTEALKRSPPSLKA